MRIYVEIFIRGSMEDLWQKSQDPKLHQRWDLRFSEIDYLPLEIGEPQKFLYSTRIGAGMRIEGEGESTGERDGISGQRISALKFWSHDSKSLIRNGSGYWKYVPGENGIRFFTFYDYQTRLGATGKIVDGILFRPLIGWATAWSFDRLRLWIEKGILPEVSRDRTVVYCLVRLTVAFVWLYHGIVPKLLWHSPDEINMLRGLGVSASSSMIALAGGLEVCFAFVLIIFWRARWPLWATIAAMFAATLAVGMSAPSYFHAAFDPLTLNLAVAALAICGLVAATDMPTAKNCLRKPPEIVR